MCSRASSNRYTRAVFLLLVWFLGWLIYRQGYARGFQDGGVTERAWREEVQRKFGPYADDAERDYTDRRPGSIT